MKKKRGVVRCPRTTKVKDDWYQIGIKIFKFIIISKNNQSADPKKKKVKTKLIKKNNEEIRETQKFKINELIILKFLFKSFLIVLKLSDLKNNEETDKPLTIAKFEINAIISITIMNVRIELVVNRKGENQKKLNITIKNSIDSKVLIKKKQEYIQIIKTNNKISKIHILIAEESIEKWLKKKFNLYDLIKNKIIKKLKVNRIKEGSNVFKYK